MDIIGEVEQDIAEVFDYRPKPGGLIDRHRKERARREEAEREQENIDAKIEQPSYKAVKVAAQSPETFGPAVYIIAAGEFRRILPNSPYRSSAVISVDTTGASVILAASETQALGGIGFTTTNGVPIRLYGRGILYAFNASGASVSVSVISELYAPE